MPDQAHLTAFPAAALVLAITPFAVGGYAAAVDRR